MTTCRKCVKLAVLLIFYGKLGRNDTTPPFTPRSRLCLVRCSLPWSQTEQVHSQSSLIECTATQMQSNEGRCMVNHTSFHGVWSDFGKSPECYTSFCCSCFADFETAFVASVASTCDEMNDQNHFGFRPSPGWAFFW